MKPHEIVAKLKKQIAELTARQTEALAASEAEGVSDEDRGKYTAEFDRCQVEKVKAQGNLQRAEQLAREAEAAERTPAVPPVTQDPFVPAEQRATAGATVAARPRRHVTLKAFKGPDGYARAERAGMWAAAALYGSEQARQWCQSNGVSLTQGSLDGSGPSATLTTLDNKAAGYFVPDEVEYAIAELAEVYGVFRRFAEVVPMGSGTKKSPRWTKGMTAYWIAEGNKPTSSDPAWDMIELVAKDLAALTKITRNLDEDSVVALGDKIAMCLAEAFALAEDEAGFNGDGTSTYGGITGLVAKVVAAAAALHTAASGNITPETLDVDDFNAVVAKYPNYTNADPRWFMHKAVWANSCQRLQLAAGGALPSDIANGGKPMFLGYPVEFVNVLKKAPVAADTSILFGDLSLSTKLGDRRGRTVEVGFENDDFTKQLRTILGTQRVDVVNHTITDPRDSTKPGPVMGLKLAAS